MDCCIDVNAVVGLMNLHMMLLALCVTACLEVMITFGAWKLGFGCLNAAL